MSAEPTIVACASALPGRSAVLRLSGPQARTIAAAAGLALPADWAFRTQDWELGPGPCPCRVLFAPAGRSYTGFDVVEIVLPGSPDLVDLALAQLHTAGAEAAGAGAFTRQALATGRLSLDQAESVLAVTQAGDAASARAAVAGLHGGLGSELEPLRRRLLELRAAVEAGLDFADEHDVQSYDPEALRAEVAELSAVLGRWRRAATTLGQQPVVCLAGPANAGKSALFATLSGEPALVSARAGTTRDWLQARWDLGARVVEIVDTAGWLDAATHQLDAAAMSAGQQRLAEAALVLLCSAPDAPLPPQDAWPPGLAAQAMVIATKADLGAPDPRAVLAVSVHDGRGLDQLAGLAERRLAAAVGGDRRQQALLATASDQLAALTGALPDDLLIAEHLATAADALGDLLGVTTPDEVLGEIFARFCIGK